MRVNFPAALLCGVASCIMIATSFGAAHAQSQRTTDASGFAAKDFPYIDEIRLGAFYHQLNDTPGERGVDVNTELLFGKLGTSGGNFWYDYFLRPRVHLGVHVNTNSDTNQLYSGVTWDLPITSRLYFETTFGGSLNDGNTHRKAGHTPLGCHAAFRESASLGLHLTERWDVLATVDHMSNAGLCEFNAGLTNAGLRFGYKW